jgi:hypothetical protein
LKLGSAAIAQVFIDLIKQAKFSQCQQFTRDFLGYWDAPLLSAGGTVTTGCVNCGWLTQFNLD